MALYESGPTLQYASKNAGVIPDDVYHVAINWFVNRTPLTSRLPKLPSESAHYLVTNDNYRPRSSNLAAALATNNGTSITVADNTIFTVNDVLQIDSEYVRVSALDSNGINVTIERGAAGTTATAHNSNSVIYLIGSSTTGAEVDKSAISRIPATVTQYNMTVQHAYAVGGALQAKGNFMGGAITPLDRDKMLAAQHVMDDFESACYYGKGVAVASGSTNKPFMKGLQALMTTNNVTSPTNASAYKPSDLVRDTMQACFTNGGNPTTLIVSSDFLSAFAIWGHAAMRLEAGANVYGTPIDVFEAPFLSGLTIIPAPLLRSGTVICLSDPEVRIRLVRPMFDKPRGSRGDATEGDIIMEGSIELDNESHHAWVQGVTGFAAA